MDPMGKKAFAIQFTKVLGFTISLLFLLQLNQLYCEEGEEMALLRREILYLLYMYNHVDQFQMCVEFAHYLWYIVFKRFFFPKKPIFYLVFKHLFL